MSRAERAFQEGYRLAWAKLGYDVSSNASGDIDMPSRHQQLADNGPGHEERVQQGIDQAFSMSNKFMETSKMPEPANVNPGINRVVGSGSFANQTQASGGYTP